MKKTLSILIPHYKEPVEVISPLLYSIANQRLVDWARVEVIVVNDGKECVLPDTLFDTFRAMNACAIKYIVSDWGGVSHARSIGLDNASGDYVMWCDCDDCFANCYGLKTIFNYIDKQDFDILNSVFYEETENGRFLIRNNEDNKNIDSTFAHAKVFNKKFLIDNNVRWDDELKFNEDVYFIHLAQTEAKRVINNYTPFYTWCYNPNSVTHNGSVDEEKYFAHCQKTMLRLLNELIKRGKTLDAQIYFLQKLFSCYCNVTTDAWCKPRSEDSKHLETNMIAQVYKKYKHLLDSIPANVEKDTIKHIRTLAYDAWFVYETITFKDWLKTLDAKI